MLESFLWVHESITERIALPTFRACGQLLCDVEMEMEVEVSFGAKVMTRSSLKRLTHKIRPGAGSP
jgi:hypothetical protein